MDLSVIILTCDNNIDLAPFVKKTCDNFEKEGVGTLIVTETKNPIYSGYQLFSIPSESFSTRFRSAVSNVNTSHVLVLLDDYFVYDNHLARKIAVWKKEIADSNFVALRVCKNKHLFKSIRIDQNQTKHYKTLNFYDIDFHPTIWNRQQLSNMLDLRNDLSPWQIEPLFKLYIQKWNLNSGISSQYIKYDELVIQGKFFRRAYIKHVKKIYDGNRRQMTISFSIKRYVKNTIYNLLPRKFITFLKKFTHKKYFSDDASL